MATRLYLSSGGTPGSTPTIRSSWERVAAAWFRAPMATTKTNFPLFTISALFGATATSQTSYYQGVSDTLDVNQTITGTFTCVIGKCGETSAGGDAHLAFSLRVMQGNTSTERGLCFEHHTTSSEFPLIASAATRTAGTAATPKTLTSVAALAGDRIVFEVGIHGVTPTNETMQMRVGDPTATADFALADALTTDLVPWIEFSQNLTFGAGAPSGQPTMRRWGGIPGMGRGVTPGRTWGRRASGVWARAA